MIIQYGRDLSNLPSDCQANSDFYLPLTQLASQIRRSSPTGGWIPAKSSLQVIPWEDRPLSKHLEIIPQPQPWWRLHLVSIGDKNYGGLPKPSLILEAGSYTVFGQDYTSTCDWQSHYRLHQTPPVTDDQFMVDRANQITEAQCQAGLSAVCLHYLDCYVRSKSNKCSNLKRRSGWYILVNYVLTIIPLVNSSVTWRILLLPLTKAKAKTRSTRTFTCYNLTIHNNSRIYMLSAG